MKYIPTNQPKKKEVSEAVTHSLLGELLRQGFAVSLLRLSVLLFLGCLFDPSDKARVTISVLLQHWAYHIQISLPKQTTNVY